MAESDLHSRIDAVRRFNRFYTRQSGVLPEIFLESPFSLTEARVLYELAHREKPTATSLSNELGLDAGYLSRILSGFEKHGLLEKTPSATDGRHSLLALTKDRRKVFAPLETRSIQQVEGMLEGLLASDQRALLGAMQTIEKLLRAPGEADRTVR